MMGVAPRPPAPLPHTTQTQNQTNATYVVGANKLGTIKESASFSTACAIWLFKILGLSVSVRLCAHVHTINPSKKYHTTKNLAEYIHI
jgi:hypothetical protein